ncbi:MAG: LytTR family transcriptional regulator [Bacteroidia bacterium]|nr:LytTR family transcriptional regulator [Bacteroidia bacterium]
MNDISKISKWIKPHIPPVTIDNVNRLCSTQEIECLCAYLVDSENKLQSKIFSKKCKIRSDQEIITPHMIKGFDYEISKKISHCKQCKYSRNPNLVSVQQLSSGFILFLIVSSENTYFINDNCSFVRDFNLSIEQLVNYYKMEYLDSRINKLGGLYNSGPRIGISDKNGTFFCYVSEILYCGADGSYTTLFLRNGSSKFLVKPLYKVEKILMEHDCFIKIHRSTIVNKNYIDKIKNHTVHMENDLLLEISIRRKPKIMKQLNII